MTLKKYITGKTEIDHEIEKLTKKYSTLQTRSYLHDLFTTVIKLHLDGADARDLYLISTTLKELRHIFRIFSRYRDVRKVVMFGSHRTPPKSKEYKMAADFAREIVKHKYMVITGGGGGAMEAGNLGAGKKGFAVKIKLPLEMEANPYVTRGEKLINVKYFFTRKLAFIKESDATVLFAGGFGTHDEGFEVLTLMQTGKCAPRPLVFVETSGQKYWQTWLNLLKVVGSVKDAVSEITNFYRNYHSIRFGRDLTIIRLNRKLPEKALKKLSKKYQDIISGEIMPSGPIAAEVRSKEFLNLPRICMKFNRRGYSRLVGLVRDLNNEV